MVVLRERIVFENDICIYVSGKVILLYDFVSLSQKYWNVKKKIEKREEDFHEKDFSCIYLMFIDILILSQFLFGCSIKLIWLVITALQCLRIESV